MSNKKKTLVEKKKLAQKIKEREKELASLKSRLLKLEKHPSPKAGVLRNVHELVNGKEKKGGKKRKKTLKGRVLFTTIVGTLKGLESEIHLKKNGKISECIKPSWDIDKIPAIPNMSLHYWWIYPGHPLKSVQKDTQNPHKQDEVYLLLQGTGSIRIGNSKKDSRKHILQEGDLIFVPKGKWHRFKVARKNKKGMKFLIFFAPNYTG